jgi:hypothetical protein
MVTALLLALVQGVGTPHPFERTFVYTCPGLDQYEIQVVHGVDSGGGSVRRSGHGSSIGIGLGPMQEELAPRRRPPGYRWYQSERIGLATLTYGLAINADTLTNGQHVRRQSLRATIFGAPISSIVNLVADPNDETEFLAVARTLAVARCTWVETKP